MALVFLVVLNTLLIVALGGLTFTFLATFLRVDPSMSSSADLPFVSVIVPARNEESKIRRCLLSLINQDYPAYEMVVVDDDLRDDTEPDH